MKPKQIYWHFLQDDGRLRYDSNELVRVKHTLVVSEQRKISLCSYGFHASKRAIDALPYAPGSLACIVTLHGNIIHGDDKSVAEGRTVLAMKDATMVLHEMACWCAENALALIDKPDPKSINAIIVKRAWMVGKATDEELAAAWAAARAVAWAAAWAAARDAAWAAAWAAARAVAWAAAWDAARNAAWAAAGDAAGDAAWDAAWDAQNTHLEMLLKKHLGWED